MRYESTRGSTLITGNVTSCLHADTFNNFGWCTWPQTLPLLGTKGGSSASSRCLRTSVLGDHRWTALGQYPCSLGMQASHNNGCCEELQETTPNESVVLAGLPVVFSFTRRGRLDFLQQPAGHNRFARILCCGCRQRWPPTRKGTDGQQLGSCTRSAACETSSLCATRATGCGTTASSRIARFRNVVMVHGRSCLALPRHGDRGRATQGAPICKMPVVSCRMCEATLVWFWQGLRGHIRVKNGADAVDEAENPQALVAQFLWRPSSGGLLRAGGSGE